VAAKLHCASTAALVVPGTIHSTIGGRAFPVAAARGWNRLPQLVTFINIAHNSSVAFKNIHVCLFGHTAPTSNDLFCFFCIYLFCMTLFILFCKRP